MCFRSMGKVGCIPSTLPRSKSHLQHSNILTIVLSMISKINLGPDYKVMKWGDGDSLDRERVRDELIDMYQLDWEACMPVQKLSTVPRKGDFFMP